MTEQLRADSDDRPVNPRPKSELNRQHIILLLAGILLILIVIGGGSLLFSETKPINSAADNVEERIPSEKEISSQIGEASSNQSMTPTELTPPKVADITTQSDSIRPLGKERIEIPGDVADQLLQNTEKNKPLPSEPSVSRDSEKTIKKPANSAANSPASVNSLPLSNFTIQISASSSQERLVAYAKQHHLTNYQVYETHREGKPWFVLIMGNYKTAADAKSAIATLPKEIQGQKPWVKSGARVVEEQQKNR